MAKVGGGLKAVFQSKANAEATRKAIADLDRISAATLEAERIERLDSATLRIHLREQNHGVAKFAGKYTVQYSTTGDSVSWRTLEGNVNNQGSARVVARPDGGSDVHWNQMVETEVPLPSLMAKAAAPLAAKITEASIRGYVGRLLGGLG